jgi:N-acylethanolamine-hydrolysing acid amidase
MADYLSGTGITLGELVGLNVLYDLTDFAHGPFLASGVFGPAENATKIRPFLPPPLGCTSILTAQKDGRILHGRNLDYGMTDLLKDATILVDFVKGGKVRNVFH